MNDAPPFRPAPRARPSLPALLYILGAFGILIGIGTSWQSWVTGGLMLESHDAYVADWQRGDPARLLMPDQSDLDALTARSAEARYARRYAALPIAAGGAIIGSLLLLGALRSMAGDKSGIALWTWAAAASLPYRLLATALGILTANEVEQALAGQPHAELMITMANYEKMSYVVVTAVLTIYFGACLLYLRKPALQARFSDGAERTKPSA